VTFLKGKTNITRVILEKPLISQRDAAAKVERRGAHNEKTGSAKEPVLSDLGVTKTARPR
jgi:hypothetical protein